jgi:hypothetical protein
VLWDVRQTVHHDKKLLRNRMIKKLKSRDALDVIKIYFFIVAFRAKNQK